METWDSNKLDICTPKKKCVEEKDDMTYLFMRC